MPVETATEVNDLNPLYPENDDERKEGAAHLRLIKQVLQTTFPKMKGVFFETQNVNGNYTLTATDNLSVKNFTNSGNLTLLDCATLGFFVLLVYAQLGVTVTVKPAGSNPIHGNTGDLVIQQRQAVLLICTGTQWICLLVPNVGKAGEIFTDGVQVAKSDVVITAGNGLTGGGDLTASRTINMGTPGTIDATSTNTASADSHTHAVADGSTSAKGIVQMVDSISTDSVTLVPTAAAVKRVNDKVNNRDPYDGSDADYLTYPVNSLLCVYWPGNHPINTLVPDPGYNTNPTPTVAVVNATSRQLAGTWRLRAQSGASDSGGEIYLMQRIS